MTGEYRQWFSRIKRLAHVAALSVAELDDSALRQAVIGDMTKAKGYGADHEGGGCGT